MRSGACSLEIACSLSNPASKTSVMNKGFLTGSDSLTLWEPYIGQCVCMQSGLVKKFR